MGGVLSGWDWCAFIQLNVCPMHEYRIRMVHGTYVVLVHGTVRYMQYSVWPVLDLTCTTTALS